MEIKEPIMGFADYKSKRYPFVFERGILNLFPPSEEEWNQNRRELIKSFDSLNNTKYDNKWIGKSFIQAITKEKITVIFYVSDDFSSDNGFITFSVLYVYECNNPNLDAESIDEIVITGREVDYFYNPGKLFELDFKCQDGKQYIAGIKQSPMTGILIGDYTYQKTNIKISLGMITSYHSQSSNPLTAKSQLIFSFSEPRDLKFTTEVYQHCKNFFMYICGRTDILLDDIHVHNANGRKRYNESVIRMYSPKVNTMEETDEWLYKRIICYDYLKDKTCLLFKAISSDEIYLENICSSLNQTKSYGIDRIILNFVAFEREYNNLYDENIVHSEEFKNVKNNILKFLHDWYSETSGKTKKHVNSFIHLIEKYDDSFSSRMRRALTDCEDVLSPFLSTSYENYNKNIRNEICDRMNILRNDSVHGNINLEIQPINIVDFAMLEDLVYAMRLKNMEIEPIIIKKAINDLKDYRLIIDE